MYFGHRYSCNEFIQIFSESEKFQGDYRNSVVYKNEKLSYSIKEVKCLEPMSTTILEIKNSMAWTELYFVNLLHLYPNYINYKGFYYEPEESKSNYDSSCNFQGKLFIITEWVPNSITLSEYLSQKQNFQDCFCLLTQVFICLEIMYKKWGIVHNDFITHNIILERIPIQENEYFIYHFDNQKYHVKNVGFKVYIWDYSYCKDSLVSFNELPIILKCLKNENIPDKYKDITRLLECLCFEKYKYNICFYPIVKNWLYRYIQTNTISGMCCKPLEISNEINIFY